MEYQKHAKIIEKIFKQAFKKIMQNGVGEFEHKRVNDLVTDADINMDRFISSKLKKHFPTYNLLTEELANNTKLEGYTFVLDPIDGTCNYANGLNLSGIQLAVFKNKTCVFSIIYLPYVKETYTAYLNGGAFLNGKKLKINSQIKNTEGIIELSDFYTQHSIKIEKQLDLVKNLQNKFLKTRLFGAACIDFTNLVTNKTQAYVSYYYHLWDIAPGLLLVKEAGAYVGSLTKEAYEYGDRNIIIANNKESLKIIKDQFNK